MKLSEAPVFSPGLRTLQQGGLEVEKVMDEQSEVPVRRKRTFGRRLLRFILFLLFFALCLAGGLVFGYVYIGKQELEEAFKPETWMHVFDLVFAP